MACTSLVAKKAQTTPLLSKVNLDVQKLLLVKVFFVHVQKDTFHMDKNTTLCKDVFVHVQMYTFCGQKHDFSERKVYVPISAIVLCRVQIQYI